MGFLLPFLVGTIIGGVVTRQIDRRRQQKENGSAPVRKWWLSTDQSDVPATQTSAAGSPDMTPSTESTTDVPPDVSSQTSDGV